MGYAGASAIASTSSRRPDASVLSVAPVSADRRDLHRDSAAKLKVDYLGRRVQHVSRVRQICAGEDV